MLKQCRVTIDGEPFLIEVEGELFRGDDGVLYDTGGLISRATWAAEGFTILDLFDIPETEQIVQKARDLICSIFDDLNIDYNSSFCLEQYHKVVTTQQLHQAVIERTRALSNEDFLINLEKITGRVSEALEPEVSENSPALQEKLGVSSLIILRINRPQQSDFNPPHRDGYLEIWKDTINVWIPIAGCKNQSSLPVITGSHLWNEADILRTSANGAKVAGRSYHVPAIVDARCGLKMIRPNPKLGQALVFTPFLIHGAAVNNLVDETRLSLELRLFGQDSQHKKTPRND